MCPKQTEANTRIDMEYDGTRCVQIEKRSEKAGIWRSSNFKQTKHINKREGIDILESGKQGYKKCTN
jgi:hypothetical protein